MEARRARDSYVESTHLVLPGQANALGTVFGGHVCAWLDLAGAVAAQRHCRRPVVTASMDDIHFHASVKVGHVAVVRAQVNAVFRTSLEVGVDVFSEDPLTGDRHHTTTAYLTFVALDAHGRPAPMPPLLCETPEEKAREADAKARRESRLARKKALRPSP
jgi:acyl-CoA hydrolase